MLLSNRMVKIVCYQVIGVGDREGVSVTGLCIPCLMVNVVLNVSHFSQQPTIRLQDSTSKWSTTS